MASHYGVIVFDLQIECSGDEGQAAANNLNHECRAAGVNLYRDFKYVPALGALVGDIRGHSPNFDPAHGVLRGYDAVYFNENGESRLEHQKRRG